MIHCDFCDRLISEGESYDVMLRATHTVGKPPPLYAAKLFKCSDCIAKEPSE